MDLGRNVAIAVHCVQCSLKEVLVNRKAKAYFVISQAEIFQD